MKNVIRLLGIIALTAVIGFSMAGCDDGDTSSGGGSELTGAVTITSGGAAITNAKTDTLLTAAYSGTETVSYQWKRGATDVSNSQTITPSEAGSYTVTVSASGYNDKTSAAVTVEFTPVTSGLSFSDYGTGYSVSKGTATDATVIIPASYKGLPVTRIDGGLIVIVGGIADTSNIGGFAEYTNMTSITIPSSVTRIDVNAFYNSGIWNNAPDNSVVYADKWVVGYKGTISGYLTLRSDTIGIGDYAFAGSGLTSITIPSSVTSIGQEAFRGCSSLTSITIPSSVTSIGEWAFYNCSGLTGITIPSGVTSISNYAFSGCSGLTSITISEGVTSIGYDAFYGCRGLTSITIPSSVTSIVTGAFHCYESLTSITVASGNTVYRSEGNCLIQRSNNTLILGCKNSVIPTSVTSIGNRAFYLCNGLTSITIPTSVTSIGDYAFGDIVRLTSVTLGTISSENFSSSAFPGNLRTLYFAGGGGAGTYVRSMGSSFNNWSKL